MLKIASRLAEHQLHLQGETHLQGTGETVGSENQRIGKREKISEKLKVAGDGDGIEEFSGRKHPASEFAGEVQDSIQVLEAAESATAFQTV